MMGPVADLRAGGIEPVNHAAVPDLEVRGRIGTINIFVNTGQPSFIGFLASRWRGEVAFERLFWFDMLVVGTLVNLAAAALSLVLFGLDAADAAAIAVFFSPLPYNLFLFAVVWRAAERARPSWALARLGAVAWLVFATLV
jgi:hypothetical protein